MSSKSLNDDDDVQVIAEVGESTVPRVRLGSAMDRFSTWVNKRAAVYPQVVDACASVGASAAQVAAFLLLFMALVVLTGFGMAGLSNSVCFVYAAYYSVTLFEKARRESHGGAELVKMLQYWITYGTFIFAEATVGLIGWVPFYFLGKMVLLVLCCNPVTQTTMPNYLYQYIIGPLLRHVSRYIDDFFISAPTADDILRARAVPVTTTLAAESKSS